jgi:hypothetical protein
MVWTVGQAGLASLEVHALVDEVIESLRVAPSLLGAVGRRGEVAFFGVFLVELGTTVVCTGNGVVLQRLFARLHSMADCLGLTFWCGESCITFILETKMVH